MQIIESLKNIESKNEDFLHLTANENVISNTARKYLSSKLGDRYFFRGGKGGIINIKALELIGLKEVEELVIKAEKSANKMLGSSLVSFSLLSGINAMISLMLAVSESGDTIMTLNPDFGGHFITKTVTERIGRKQIITQHKSNREIDIKKTMELFNKKKAKILYLDSMSVIDKFPLNKIKPIMKADSKLIFDASHTMGLIMGGQYQSPLKEGADVIVGNSHKTFPGPHKAIVAFKEKEYGKKIMSIISNCLISTVQTNSLIALAITVLEVEKFGKAYAKQIVLNSCKLAKELEEKGYKLVKTIDSNYTHNHQLHILLGNIKNKDTIMRCFYKNNISINIIKPRQPSSFIRLGVQEVTRRGMKEKEMSIIAEFFDESIKKKNIRNEVINLIKKFKKVQYSFD